MAKLMIVSGKQEGASFDVNPPIVFGRSDDTDITVPDQRISRSHGKFTREDGIYHLEDLDSSNGTKINGSSIQKQRIEDGDRIEAGETEMVFLLNPDELTAYEDEEETNEVEPVEEPSPQEEPDPEDLDDAGAAHPPEPDEPSPEGPSIESEATELLTSEWVLFVLGALIIAGVFLASYFLTKMILPVLFK